MEGNNPKDQTEAGTTPAEERPLYEPPAMIRYTDEQLLEALGPAQAGGIYSPFIGP